MSKNRDLGAPLQLRIVTAAQPAVTTFWDTDVYAVDTTVGAPATITLDPHAVEGDAYVVTDAAGNAAAQPITINGAIIGFGGSYSIAQNYGYVQFVFSQLLGQWLAYNIGAHSAGPTNAWVQGGNSFGAPGVLRTNDAQPLELGAGGANLMTLGAAGGVAIAPAAASSFVTSAGALTLDAATNVNVGVTGATNVNIGHVGATTAVAGALTQTGGSVSLAPNAASSLITSAGGLTLDAAAAVIVGGTNATAVNVGHVAITTSITGALAQSGGSVTLAPNAASSLTTSAGALTLDAAAAVNVGATATAVNIGHGAITTAITGALTQSGGGVTMTPNAASSLVTSAGALTLDAATAVNLGNTDATAVNIGHGAITTTVTGTLSQGGGAVTMAPNAASSIATSAGALTLTSKADCLWSSGGQLTLDSTGAPLNLGTINSTSIVMGSFSGILTTIFGNAVPPGGGFGQSFVLRLDNTGAGNTNGGLAINAGSNAGSGALFLDLRRPDGTQVGNVNQSAANQVTYATTSDARRKTNVVRAGPALDAVRRMRVVEFTWDDDPDERHHGFIAQELHEIYPRAVHVGGDDPRRDPWGIDYGRVTPLLAKAIQELDARLDHMRCVIGA